MNSPYGGKAVSIRTRLTSLARSAGETAEAVFLRYGRERLLYRLSTCEYSDRFVLKGAALFYVWANEPHRPTKDIDLLGYGVLDIKEATDVFRSVCSTPCEDDGVVFDANSVSAVEIREDSEYGGVRVKFQGDLCGARLRMQIDVGVGDAVFPRPETIEYPAVLPQFGLPSARLLAYPKEAVVAEKLQTIVKLGMFNSRMKDYYDLLEIASFFTFGGDTLLASLRATFERRDTPLPKEPPIGLTPEFATDPTKRAQWQAFLRRLDKEGRPIDEVVDIVRDFAWPPLEAASRGEKFARDRVPGGPWA